MIKLKDIINLILEATRKEIQTNFAGPVRDSIHINVRLQSVNTKTKRINFVCVDREGSRIPRNVRIAMDDHKYLSRDADLKRQDKIDLALTEGELRYTCDCPSFSYGGFAYISTIHKSNLGSEKRRPLIRNPREEGLTCKHIKAVIDQLEKFIPKIASEFKRSTSTGSYGLREVEKPKRKKK